MASFGNKLKSLREAKGMSVEELSEITHANRELIREFESDNFAKVTAAVYGRAFVKEFAKVLGADPAPLRDSFDIAYQEWIEAKSSVSPVNRPPQKFTDRRNHLVNNDAGKPQQNSIDRSPDKATPSKSILSQIGERISEVKRTKREAEKVIPSLRNDQADLFSAKPEAEVFQTQPPQVQRIPDVAINETSKPVTVSKPVTRPAFFDDEISAKSFDFKQYVEQIRQLAQKSPVKFVCSIAAFCLVLTCIIAILSGGNSGESVAADVPGAYAAGELTNADPAEIVKNSDAVLNRDPLSQPLVSPPEPYAR